MSLPRSSPDPRLHVLSCPVRNPRHPLTTGGTSPIDARSTTILVWPHAFRGPVDRRRNTSDKTCTHRRTWARCTVAMPSRTKSADISASGGLVKCPRPGASYVVAKLGASVRNRRQGPHHDVGGERGGEFRDDMPKPTLRTITSDGISHFLRHNKTHPGHLGWIALTWPAYMHDDRGPRCPHTVSKAGSEVCGSLQTAGSGQHEGTIRPTVGRGPCDDDLPGWRGLRECAYGCGNRGYGCGGDCSAGRYACSCENSP